MANNVGRLGVVLGLDTAQFIAGLDNAGKMLEKFGNAVEKYGKMGVAAMVAAGTQALAYADELNDVAKANDITIASVLKLQEALATNGGSAENAGKMFASFSSYVESASLGSIEAQDKFAKMGVSLKDLATLGTQELFDKALAGTANIADSLTRNAVGISAFGKAIKGVDIKGANEDYKAANEILKEQANRIKQAADVWDEFKKHGLDASAAIASAIGPSMNELIKYFKEMGGESNLVAEGFRIAFETIAVVGANVAFVVQGIASDIYQLYQNTKLFFQLDFSGITANNKKNLEEFDARLKRLQEFEQRVMGTQDFWSGKKTPTSKEDDASSNQGRKVLDARAKETKQLQAKLELTKATLEIQTQENALSLDSLEGNKLANQYHIKALNLEKQLAQIQYDRTESLNNEKLNAEQKGLINKQFDLQQAKAQDEYATKVKALGIMDRLAFQDQLRSVTLTKDRVDYEATLLNLLPREKEYLLAMYDIEAQITEYKRQQRLAGVSDTDIEQRSKALETVLKKQVEIQEQTKDQQETFKYGWDEAYRHYVDNTLNAANIAGQAFNSIIGNMNNAIDEFVRTGKFSFKDFARSVIQDLWAIQLKAQAVKLFDFAQGGIFGAVKTMFGTFGKSGTVNMETPVGGEFADGGNPPVGVPSLVGERGPELFIPRSAGTIIPNGSLASAMGGGGQTVNYNGPYIANMSAIDTQTGVQFLAKNKQTIWASYQSANRSVPVSR